MGLQRLIWYGLFGFIFVLQINPYFAMGSIMGNILTNEVLEVPKEEDLADEPFCRSGSACGYVQVNAFGVTQHQICRCPSTSSVCPLHWDPEDGHSITIGSQQYKYCGPAPNLPSCKRSEPAYTHAMFFDQLTYDVISIMATLHCSCIAPRTHVFHESTDDVIENMHVLGTVHTCEMLPKCEFNTACKEISVARSSTLVQTNCQCRRGLICPTLSSHASQSNRNDNFSSGRVFSVHCQPWY